jgi:histidinol-phosphatase
VDPLDGTKNFIRGIPLFGTLIAMLHRSKPVVGLISLPVLREKVFAVRGNGAFNHAGLRLRVSETALPDAHVSFGGLNHFQRIGAWSALTEIVQRSARSRAIGDCYSYCLIAAGKCDAVIEAKVGFWDIAAAAVIVEEAGGMVTDLEGKPIGQQTTTVLASNGKIHSTVLEIFRNELSEALPS